MSEIALPYGIMLAVSASFGPSTEAQPGLQAAVYSTAGIMARTAQFDAAKLNKWQVVSSRFRTQTSIGGEQSGRSRQWQTLVDQARSVPAASRIAWVNRKLNKVRYRSDASNWGASDHWATPIEFIERGGDCEDYAIAKYRILRELGVSASDMQIAITRDHAVLIVDTAGGPVVLDNLRRKPYGLKAKTVRHILFTFNDSDWTLNLG